MEKLRSTISDGVFRLIININDLRNFDENLANKLLRQPREFVVALQEVATEISQSLDSSTSKTMLQRELQVGFDGSFGANSVSPRGLLSSQLNRLVEVEGIVTKCSNVKPKLVKSVHYCAKTKAYSTREFRDQTALDIGIKVGSVERLPTSSVMPTEDKDGNVLDTEYGLCQYKDYQVVTLQEMPERAKVGQLPRSVECILEYDLVDSVKPGDRVQCIGIYRPLGGAIGPNGVSSGIFKSTLLCNNMKIIGKEIGGVRLTGEDVVNIRQICRRPDLTSLVSKSLCPSIFGHEHIKTALVLQLLGGCEQNLDNGIHLRGDINIMMVGDPSTAKSQLLRTVLDIAPLAISTSGRGSSGVGLTAAVTSDPETGERKLEAGAMVLADRGVVCIDEFDKMGENDRVAIHEVMEQQTVTIAKAGIHASLNARCSVLAAANPIYGQYDRNRPPQENIGLPDSLLSRFDLLFIVLDQFDSSFDRKLSEHVIKSHQYRRPGTTSEPEPLVQSTSSLRLEYATANSGNNQQADSTAVWQRGGAREYVSTGPGGSSSAGQGMGDNSGDLLTKEFLRKLIFYAKNKVAPVLSDDAMESISATYGAMRNQPTENNGRRNLPVTARSLETLIRLSTANAKLRLSSSVDVEDVEAAKELVHFVLFREVNKAAPVLDELNKENANASANATDVNGKRKSLLDGLSGGDNLKKSKVGDINHTAAGGVVVSVDQGSSRMEAPQTSLAPEDLRLLISEIISEGTIEFEDLAQQIEGNHGVIDRSELERSLQVLHEDNSLMYTNGTVYIV